MDLIEKVSSSIVPVKLDKCKLPKKMSPELAEEFGIHLGDGHMAFRKYSKGYTAYPYTITSGKNELEYLKDYVFPLIRNLYGLNGWIYKSKKDNSISLHFKSKSLFSFKKALGFPDGKKDNAVIPQAILESDCMADFLRGLFDTDGCIQFKDRNKKAPLIL